MQPLGGTTSAEQGGRAPPWSSSSRFHVHGLQASPPSLFQTPLSCKTPFRSGIARSSRRRGSRGRARSQSERFRTADLLVSAGCDDSTPTCKREGGNVVGHVDAHHHARADPRAARSCSLDVGMLAGANFDFMDSEEEDAGGPLRGDAGLPHQDHAGPLQHRAEGVDVPRRAGPALGCSSSVVRFATNSIMGEPGNQRLHPEPESSAPVDRLLRETKLSWADLSCEENDFFVMKNNNSSILSTSSHVDRMEELCSAKSEKSLQASGKVVPGTISSTTNANGAKQRPPSKRHLAFRSPDTVATVATQEPPSSVSLSPPSVSALSHLPPSARPFPPGAPQESPEVERWAAETVQTILGTVTSAEHGGDAAGVEMNVGNIVPAGGRGAVKGVADVVGGFQHITDTTGGLTRSSALGTTSMISPPALVTVPEKQRKGGKSVLNDGKNFRKFSGHRSWMKDGGEKGSSGRKGKHGASPSGFRHGKGGKFRYFADGTGEKGKVGKVVGGKTSHQKSNTFSDTNAGVNMEQSVNQNPIVGAGWTTSTTTSIVERGAGRNHMSVDEREGQLNRLRSALGDGDRRSVLGLVDAIAQ